MKINTKFNIGTKVVAKDKYTGEVTYIRITISENETISILYTIQTTELTLGVFEEDLKLIN